MIEIVRELVDAVARLRGISGNRAAELHEQLDQAAEVASLVESTQQVALTGKAAKAPEAAESA